MAFRTLQQAIRMVKAAGLLRSRDDIDASVISHDGFNSLTPLQAFARHQDRILDHVMRDDEEMEDF